MIGAFESTVRQFPQRTCFTYVDEAGNETAYSYRETRMLSAALARLLLDRGVRPGDCVAVDLPNDPAYVLVMLAAAYGGFALVALNNRLTDAAGQISVSDATAHAACLTAKDVNASAIVTVSESGNTARLLSKYRPAQPIIACVMDEQVQRQLSISWGITPLMMDLATSTDELIEMSTALAKENGYLHDGELAVVTAGVPVGVSGTTNMMKVHVVGHVLLTGDGVTGQTVSARLCVCKRLSDIPKRFRDGDILVVPETDNTIVDYLRRCSGIITEEGGTNSHAAIAGLAMDKPVITGAEHATDLLKSGAVVCLDAKNGRVSAC